MIRSLDEVGSSRVVGVIVGRSGSGKTFLSGTLDGNTIIASAESGLICLKKFPKEVRDRIQFWEINTMNDLKKLFIYLLTDEAKKKYQNVYIDSLTEIGEKLLLELKASDEYKDPKFALKMYGQYNDDFTKFVKALRDIKPYNVWFTCLNTYEKDGMELKEEFSFPGAKVKDKVKSWVDIVLKYEVFEIDGVNHRKLITDDSINPLAKDRTGLLNKYEEPHLGSIMTKILKGV